MTGNLMLQRLMDDSDTRVDRTFAHQLVEMLAIPVFVLDADSRVMIWNCACEHLTGVAAADVVGTRNHCRSFFGIDFPTLADVLVEGPKDDVQPLQPTRGVGQHLSAQTWYNLPGVGRRRFLAADASPIYDERGRLFAAVQTLRDITDEKMAQLALEQLATRDGLTGLANRRCFDDTLRAEWARALRQRIPLSLLMVDVDHFKAYNDANGHQGGDECLKRVAAAVASEMRTNDLVARYGGEEFAVILPNESLKGAATVAERIRTRVEQLRLPDGLPSKKHVTVSIGAATAMAGPDTSAGELVAIADAALYRAKQTGRNRISLPSDEGE